MSAPVFIGDEVTAAGFRLAGARTATPAESEVDAVFAKALESADLILITAEYAAKLSATAMAGALASVSPLVLVTPDSRRSVEPPDLLQQIESTLGIQS